AGVWQLLRRAAELVRAGRRLRRDALAAGRRGRREATPPRAALRLPREHDPPVSRGVQEAAPAGRDHRAPERRPSVEPSGHRGLLDRRPAAGPGRSAAALTPVAARRPPRGSWLVSRGSSAFAGAIVRPCGPAALAFVALVAFAPYPAVAHTFEVTDTRL